MIKAVLLNGYLKYLKSKHTEDVAKQYYNITCKFLNKYDIQLTTSNVKRLVEKGLAMYEKDGPFYLLDQKRHGSLHASLKSLNDYFSLIY